MIKQNYPNHFVEIIFRFIVMPGCFILVNPINNVNGQVIFSNAGTGQQFTVPANVTSIQVKAWGAAGGSYCCGTPYANVGGAGGFAGATLAVTPGEVLIVDVGGGGILAGGINGGGPGTYSGGGGATDIRRDTTYLLVAGGGGGSGNGDGGAGGGLSGGWATVCSSATSGGTQTSGGLQESCSGNATDGSFHQGGEGEEGGGGGGWYGGGGGSCGCGGGGGSGYVTGTCTSLIAAPGYDQGYGYVGVAAANDTDPDYNGTAGMAVVNGDTTGTYGIEAPGYPGLLVIRYNVGLGTPNLYGDTTPCAKVATTYKADPNMSNYVWMVVGGAIQSGGGPLSDSVTVLWDSAGTISVSYTTCSSSSNITTLNVTPSSSKTPLATISANPSGPVCQGTTITFTVSTNNTGSITAYQWQLDSSDINPGGDSSVLYFVAQNNNAHIACMITANDGCGGSEIILASPYVTKVNPLPSPVINATDTLICANDSAQLCATGDYVNYLWNTQDTSACTKVKNAGGFWVSVTDTNGCSNSSPHINIHVYPVSQVSIVASGDTLFSFDALSYQWYFNGNPIPGADSSIEIATENGNYAVQITDSNGCTATSKSFYIAATGIDDLLTGFATLVYPNPASEQVAIASNEEINEIRLFNMMGQEVKYMKVEDGGNKKIIMQLSTLPPGVYQLQISVEKVIVYKELSVITNSH